MMLFRLFGLRNVPRYRRRKMARGFSMLFDDLKLICMAFFLGVISGCTLILYVLDL